MKVIDFGADVWNAFFVAFERQPEETLDRYLERTFACLEEFYRQHTTDPNPSRVTFPLSEFTEEDKRNAGGNFCDFLLPMYCDVKYRIYSEKPRGLPEGINVTAHRMESRRAQVAYLKDLWEKFTPTPA